MVNFVTLMINCTNDLFQLHAKENNVPAEAVPETLSKEISRYKKDFGMHRCSSAILPQSQKESITLSSLNISSNSNKNDSLGTIFSMKNVILLSGGAFSLRYALEAIQDLRKGNYKRSVLNATAGAITGIMSYTLLRNVI